MRLRTHIPENGNNYSLKLAALRLFDEIEQTRERIPRAVESIVCRVLRQHGIGVEGSERSVNADSLAHSDFDLRVHIESDSGPLFDECASSVLNEVRRRLAMTSLRVKVYVCDESSVEVEFEPSDEELAHKLEMEVENSEDMILDLLLDWLKYKEHNGANEAVANLMWLRNLPKGETRKRAYNRLCEGIFFTTGENPFGGGAVVLEEHFDDATVQALLTLRDV